MTQLFIVMGVSGSGKSSVGQALADDLNCPFFDGDDFHPPANVDKMRAGTPLSDADRWPWLARLAELLVQAAERGETAVLACSALKKSYRDRLRVNTAVQFIHLHGPFDLIWQRLQTRQNHYMQANMLQSQFDTLEPPLGKDVQTIPINQPIHAILTQILQPSVK